jgi:hypothetical protein
LEGDVTEKDDAIRTEDERWVILKKQEE